jgi:hypothetical protein
MPWSPRFGRAPHSEKKVGFQKIGKSIATNGLWLTTVQISDLSI